MVFKLGRTTGATAGTINGCRAETRVYTSRRSPVHSTELVILPHALDGATIFAYDGDSGALVYNGVGKADSMIWGRTLQDGQPLLDLSRIVFATPVPIILDSIKATVQKMNAGVDVKVVLY